MAELDSLNDPLGQFEPEERDIKKKFPVEYRLEVTFHKDALKVIVTDKSLRFEGAIPELQVTHRHVRLMKAINDLVKEYIRNNS